MRSSDWSSAVCSSDLRCAQAAQERPAQKRRQQRRSNQCPSPTGEDLKKIEGRSSLAGKPPFPSPTSSKTYWAYGAAALASRSEERRVGNGGVRTCRSRWSHEH